MIQVLADGVLIYDSRVEDYDLLGLTVTTGLNKGGTAEIILPPNHPGYSAFVSYKTIVEIYRDQTLKFRGRALQVYDNFYKQRTIVCEGELCFFQDAVSRPYLYQDEPATIFTALVQSYNSQVEAGKQFLLGYVEVTDPNGYVRLESESAESVLDTLNKLLERCGGVFVFSTRDDGKRTISWRTAAVGYQSSQRIEFGENLLDFAREGVTSQLATAVLPYGAVDETTGQRVTIESVNNGQDYIQDDAAVAVRGFIIKPVYWDDVTLPENLLRKALDWLRANRYIITSLTLTAFDLSLMDKSIDSFEVGDKIHVYSKPHDVDEDFILTDRTEDLLRPDAGQITLGKEKSTLTDADVAGDNWNRNEMHKIKHQIIADYKINAENVIKETERTFTSLIEQESTKIKSEVAEEYVTNGELDSKVSTSLEQTNKQFLFEFDTLKKIVDDNDANAREQFEEIHQYISFEGGVITLGTSENAITLTIENDMLIFRKNGEQFGWWDGVDFHTGNIVVEVNERAQFGDFAFIPRSNKSLDFLKVR